MTKARGKKFRMLKAGTADINGRAFSWKEGDRIALSDSEITVLKRGGYTYG